MTQRLLWLVGGSLSFHPPLVTQVRNVHDYLADFDSEVPLYMKSGQLIRFLGEGTPVPTTSRSSKWTTVPTTTLSLDSAMWSLAKELYQHCYWGQQDLQLVEAWLQDLHNLGYRWEHSLLVLLIYIFWLLIDFQRL